MPDYDLGTARGRIEIDGSQAERTLNNTAQAQDRLNSGAKSTSAAMNTVGLSLLGVGAAAVGGFAIAVNAAANFEKSMSGIAAVSGATEDQLESLRKKALQLGADTSFSAGEAAGAMEELVKAGLSVEEVLNGAADATVALAAAGEIDLTQAATIAANAMNQFNLAAEDLPKVADLIAGAANASAIDVGDFGLAMQQAGATANLVGLSFDDLAVAIAAMGNAGIRGSDAGTSLKTMLANLQPTTEKQIGTMRDLGLVWEENGVLMNKFFDESGRIKDLGEIAGILEQSLAGLTDQQKALTLETIFGSDAIRAAAIIADTGAAGFAELATQMGKVTAEDVAAKRLDNFAGSMEQLRGSVETLLITIGTPFLGFLRDVVDAITGWVNWLGQLNPAILTWVAGIGVATGALAGLGGAIILAVGYIRQLQAALTLLLAHPVVLVVAAIVAAVVALGVGLFLLYKHNERFREIVDQVGDALQQAWKWAQENIPPILRQIADFIVNEVIPALQQLWDDTYPILKGIADFIIGEIIPAIIDFGKTVVEIGKDIGEVATDIFNWFSEHVFPVFVELALLVEAIAQRVQQAIQFMVQYWQAQFEIIRTVTTTVFSIIQPLIQAAMEIIKTVIKTAIDIILNAWNLFGDNIIEAVQIAFNFIKGYIEAVLGIIKGIIHTVTALINGDWEEVWEGIKQIFQGAWDFMLNIVTTVIAAIRLIIEQFVDIINFTWDNFVAGIRLAWDTLWNLIKGSIQSTINFLQTIILGGLGNIISFFSSLPGKILEALGKLATFLFQAGYDLLLGFLNGYNEVWTRIVKFFQDLPGRIVGFIGKAVDILFDVGKKIMEGLKNGIEAGLGAVKDFVTGIGGKLVSWKGPEQVDKKLLVPAGEWIMEGLKRGIQNELPSIQRMLTGFTTQMGDLQLAPFPSPAGTGGGVTLNFNFGDLTSPDAADAVRRTVTDPTVLNEIVRAARAGRR